MSWFDDKELSSGADTIGSKKKKKKDSTYPIIYFYFFKCNFKSFLTVNFFNHKINSIETLKESIQNDHIIDTIS